MLSLTSRINTLVTVVKNYAQVGTKMYLLREGPITFLIAEKFRSIYLLGSVLALDPMNVGGLRLPRSVSFKVLYFSYN